VTAPDIGQMPTSTFELWYLLGALFIAGVTSVVTSWIQNLRQGPKLKQVAEDTAATKNQVSNGQKTLMRDDVVETRDLVLCLRGKIDGLIRSVEVIQERQIHTEQEVAEIRERVSGLTDDIQNCPLRHPDNKGN
jgi:hypothetical protein